MLRILGAILLSTIAFLPTPALAWGEFGHLTVCDLAYRNLTEPSKAALKVLFNKEGGGIDVPAGANSEARHYTSFNVGCLEEDTRPKKHPKDHFINVDRSLGAITDGTCPLSPSSGQPLQCIFEGIERDVSILRDTSKSRLQRVIALMAIGHWVGDLHQPLHISYADDVGGNNISLSFSGKCGTSASGRAYRPDNLHSVWDNCLLENGLFQKVRSRDNFNPNWSRRTITYRAVDTLLANTTLAQEKMIVAGQPWQWAAESFAIARQPMVEYCALSGDVCQFTVTQRNWTETGTPRKVTVGLAYFDRFKGVAEDRVRYAGYRLAHLLNQALDPGYTTPIGNSGQPS